MFKQLAIFLSVTAVGLSGTASALPVVSNGANNALASAQNINGFFDLSANPQIENSTTVPHVEILGRSGDDTFDYFGFTVAADDTPVIFDIDCGYRNSGNTGCDGLGPDDFFDAYLELFTAGGAFIAADDDDFTLDPGSENSSNLDSLLRTTLDAGDYAIRVGAFPGVEVPDGADYILNVSLGRPATTVAAPGVALLLGTSLLGIGATRRRVIAV